MCLSTPNSLVSYLYSKVWAQTHRKKTRKKKKKIPICSNRQGQQVVNVNQYLKQNTRPLSLQLSKWKRHVKRSAQLADRSRPRSAPVSKGDEHGEPGGTARRHRGAPCAHPPHGAAPPRSSGPGSSHPWGQLTPLSFPELGKLILWSEERGSGTSTKSPRHWLVYKRK